MAAHLWSASSLRDEPTATCDALGFSSPPLLRGNDDLCALLRLPWRTPRPPIVDLSYRPDTGEVTAVVNLRPASLHCAGRLGPWLRARWRCVFPTSATTGVSVVNSVASPDPAGASWLVVCSNVPPELVEEARGFVALQATLGDGRVVAYHPRRFCKQQPLSLGPDSLVACTVLRAAKESQLREWAAAIQGDFDMLVILADGRRMLDVAKSALQPLIALGKVFIAEWTGGSEQQAAGEVACLRRLNGRARWVSFIDIDEFFVCNSSQDLRDWIKLKAAHGTNVAAISVHRTESFHPLSQQQYIIDPSRTTYHFLRTPTQLNGAIIDNEGNNSACFLVHKRIVEQHQ